MAGPCVLQPIARNVNQVTRAINATMKPRADLSPALDSVRRTQGSESMQRLTASAWEGVADRAVCSASRAGVGRGRRVGRLQVAACALSI